MRPLYLKYLYGPWFFSLFLVQIPRFSFFLGANPLGKMLQELREIYKHLRVELKERSECKRKKRITFLFPFFFFVYLRFFFFVFFGVLGVIYI